MATPPTTDLMTHLRARVALLQQEQEQETQQYAELEQHLLALRRNMDMRYGALQELTGLVARCAPTEEHDHADEAAPAVGTDLSGDGADEHALPNVAPAVGGAESGGRAPGGASANVTATPG